MRNCTKPAIYSMMKQKLHWFSVWLQTTFLHRLWYTDDLKVLRALLWPISLLYQGVVWLRYRSYARTLQAVPEVPVIVVGNLTVGGVGKTPLVIALANGLKARGLSVGIVSRGYGAKIQHVPHEVSLTDTPIQVGDEPLCIAKRTHCPVVIAPKRAKAVEFLCKHHRPQVIISDDGLQHHALARTVEIVVIDAVRQFGNGYCLPAGPLREPRTRLNTVDFIVLNGTTDLGHFKANKTSDMQLLPGALRELSTDKEVPFSVLQYPLAAVAGIGHPERFFAMLNTLNIPHQAYAFPDHHPYSQRDFEKLEKTVVMTEKDAVKCKSFATADMYYLPIDATLNNDFWDALWIKLGQKK